MRKTVWIIAALATVLACASKDAGDAETALADAEKAITDVHAYALKYAPEEFKSVMDEYSVAREALAAHDYDGAVRSARRAVELAKEVGRAATRHRKALEDNWPALRDSVSSGLAAIEERLAELSAAEALPRGITNDQIAAANDAIEEMRSGLEQATRAFEKGEIRDAVHAATRLKSRVDDVMASLGMKALAKA